MRKYPTSSAQNIAKNSGYMQQNLGYPAKNEFSYVDWLNASREENNSNFVQISAHQASMIQKYSAPGSNGMIESKFYMSPRAQLATPMSSANQLGLNNQNERIITSPPEMNSGISYRQPINYRHVDDRTDSSNLDILSHKGSVDGYSTLNQRRDSTNTNVRKTPVVKQK